MFTGFSPVHRLRIAHPNHVGEVLNWFLALNHPVEAASLKRALMPPLPSLLDTAEHLPGCPASDAVALVALGGQGVADVLGVIFAVMAAAALGGGALMLTIVRVR